MVGGDPYLNLVRASTYLAENQYKTARQYAEKAIAAESDLVYAYFSLIAISLAEKDFDETSRLLTAIREKFPEEDARHEADSGLRRIPEIAAIRGVAKDAEEVIGTATPPTPASRGRWDGA